VLHVCSVAHAGTLLGDATVGDVVMFKVTVTVDIDMNGRVDYGEPGLAGATVRPGGAAMSLRCHMLPWRSTAMPAANPEPHESRQFCSCPF
jgi:hypothetical protein